MILKDLFTGTSQWLRSHRYEQVRAGQPQLDLDEDGLMIGLAEPEPPKVEVIEPEGQGDNMVVQIAEPAGDRGPLAKPEDAIDRLVDQLEGINTHLCRQLAQHEEFMSRVGQLPELIEHLPEALDEQKRLLEQIAAGAARNQQFVEAVENIPAEAAKQTDMLTNIDHQLSASAETDVQMAENFNKFNTILDRLHDSTVNNTEGVMQMSRTFAASDRYFKYMVSKQSRRFIWLYVTTVGVCLGAIAALTGIVVYLLR